MDQPSVAWPAQASDAAPAGYMGAHDGSWILGRGRRQLRIEPDFEGSAGRNEGGGTSAGRVGVSFDGSASRAAPWRASRARDSHGAEAPCGSKASGRSTGQLKGGVGGQAAKSAVLVTVGRRGRRAPVAWGGLRDSQGVPNPCHCCTHEDESSEAGEHMHGTRRRRTSLRPNPPRARLAAENAEGTESTDLDIAAENTDGKDSTDDGTCMCGAEDIGGAQHGMARGVRGPLQARRARRVARRGALYLVGCMRRNTAADERGALWKLKGCSPNFNKGRCWRRGAEGRRPCTRLSSARGLAQIVWCFGSLAGKVLSGAYFAWRAI